MNPYTGQTTPLNTDLLLTDIEGELARAAKDVDCAIEDLVLVTGKKEHVNATSAAVASYNGRTKKERAKNKRARKQRKVNRR